MSKGLLARIVAMFWMEALARVWFFSCQSPQGDLTYSDLIWSSLPSNSPSAF
jgi:hypothetical protein